MTDAVTFPSWWGPKSGDPIHCRNPLEIQEGWVQHFGHYDVQIGQFVPDGGPLDHDKDGRPGGSTSSVEDIKALRAAYAKKLGKKPFPGWDAAELKRRMA